MLYLLCVIFVGFAGVVCAYHFGLGLVGLFCRRVAQPQFADDPTHRFAIVIPAHNEQAILATTIQSCDNLDYPKEQYQVIVIADNCSDRTAAIAVSCGAKYLERFDEQNKSKGHALQWAIPRVLADDVDAILVLDADCRLNAASLRTFDWYLSCGHQVIQANDVVANPDASSLSYLLAVANTLENDFFYHPKSVIGLAVFLRGTGMVIHRDVLKDVPWDASSSVEDTEYTCRLLQRGIPITFAPHARVASDFPCNHRELAIQRERWIGGGSRMARTFGMKLIWKGLVGADMTLADAGWSLCIISRPLVILQFLATSFLCLTILLLQPGVASVNLVAMCIGIAVAYAFYIILGVCRLGASKQRLALLLKTPWLIAAYVELTVKTLCLGGGRNWRPRENADPLVE